MNAPQEFCRPTQSSTRTESWATSDDKATLNRKPEPRWFEEFRRDSRPIRFFHGLEHNSRTTLEELSRRACETLHKKIIHSSSKCLPRSMRVTNRTDQTLTTLLPLREIPEAALSRFPRNRARHSSAFLFFFDLEHLQEASLGPFPPPSVFPTNNRPHLPPCFSCHAVDAPNIHQIPHHFVGFSGPFSLPTHK